MVEVRTKQTDWTVVGEIFGISKDKNRGNSENEFEKWRKENISVVENTEGNINNLIAKTFSIKTRKKQKSLKTVTAKVNSKGRTVTAKITKAKIIEDNERVK